MCKNNQYESKIYYGELQKNNLYRALVLYQTWKIQKYLLSVIPANIYLFKVNNKNTRKRCQICSKLTIKTPERRDWRQFDVFINLEHI